MEDTPRLTPPMRAILQCTGCLAADAPIPRSLLAAMLTTNRQEANTAVNRLLKVGLLTRSGRDAVLVSERGREFLATRPSGERVRWAVEMALLNVTTPLLSEEATAGLAAYLPHLQVVTLAALPRADEMTELLVKALVIALLTLKEYDTARAIADQVKLQEAASGRTLLPANLDDTFQRIEENTIQMTEGMHLILQSLACLAADMPVPLAVVYHVFEPGAGIDTAVTELAALDLVTQPETQMVQLTARGQNLIGQVQTEVEASVVGALVKVTNQAIAAGDNALLGQLEPHMRALATQVLPRVDAAARHLLSALCQCLSHLGRYMDAVEYIDTFEKLERTPGIFRQQGAESPVEREQSLQYHAQAGVHYYAKGNYEQASRHFEKAIPATDDAAILAGLYQKLGECYGVLGDDAAELTAYVTALEQALAHYGRDSWQIAPHRCDLALILTRHGEYEAALAHLQEARSQCQRAETDDPRFYKETAKVYLLLADVYYRQRQPEAGWQMVESCLALLPQMGTQWLDRARLLYFVSSLLQRNGDEAAARPVIAEALQVCETDLDPDDGQVAALQALIESLHEMIAG
ncbi:MAG: tetratricopeptide repeat protein [Chloroflexi bacterium]|nr:tetratricopeptide repeat protein [Chloroflexota bacterium]